MTEFDADRTLEFARALGRTYATHLNNTPHDAANWSALSDGDDLPEFDYLTLRYHYGVVTASVEDAYRRAFNSTFTTR